MQRKDLLPGALLVIILSALANWGCSKLDTTDIGADQIPAVDNVHTFADTLNIETTQGFFNDTTKISRTEDHVLGKIIGDPLFGQTNADIYMQLKPGFFPFYYGAPKDTIDNSLVSGTGFDSVVLCINYKGFWGDSTVPLNFEVRTVNSNNGIWDSIYKTRDINYMPNTGTVIGRSGNIDVRRLGDTVRYSNKNYYGVNQIRIRLNMGGFENLLFSRDSSASGANNAFRSDSLFKLFNNGVAVIATAGNGLAYCNLADTNTKLEVHYRRRNGGITIDTAYTSFKLNANSSIVFSGGSIFSTPSSTADHIVRNRAGSPSASPTSNEVYLQTAPGSYVDLRIPKLDTLSNRIIHRAELIIQQIPTTGGGDDIFTAPSVVYVDLKDTGTTQKWKPVYTDLNPADPYDPDATTGYYYPFNKGIDLFYYGGYRRNKVTQLGVPISYYNINISRYIQRLVTKRAPNYTLRLYAPYSIQYPQMSNPSYITSNNALAKGRVKLGSGTNGNTDHRMMLRIIYSKL